MSDETNPPGPQPAKRQDFTGAVGRQSSTDSSSQEVPENSTGDTSPSEYSEMSQDHTPPFKVTITGTTKKNFNASTVYKMTVEAATNGSPYEIQRSYDDFYDLHCLLTVDYGQKGHIIPIVPPEKYGQRTIQKYLVWILKNSNLSGAPLVMNFLRDGGYTKTGNEFKDLAARVLGYSPIEDAFLFDKDFPDEIFPKMRLDELEHFETTLTNLKSALRPFERNVEAMMNEKRKVDEALAGYSNQNELPTFCESFRRSSESWDKLLAENPTELSDTIEDYFQFLLSVKYAIRERRRLMEKLKKKIDQYNEKEGKNKLEKKDRKKLKAEIERDEDQLVRMSETINPQLKNIIEEEQKTLSGEMKAVLNGYKSETIEILQQFIKSLDVNGQAELLNQEDPVTEGMTYKVEVISLPYPMYKLKVEVSEDGSTGRPYEIHRRYNNFLDLHCSLYEKYVKKGRIIPIIPPKEEMTGEKQRRLLQNYMNRIIRDRELVNDESVTKFLGREDYTEKLTFWQKLWTTETTGYTDSRNVQLETNWRGERDWFDDEVPRLGQIETTLNQMKNQVERFKKSVEKTVLEAPTFFERFKEFASIDELELPIDVFENGLSVWGKYSVEYSNALSDTIEDYSEFIVSIKHVMVERNNVQRELYRKKSTESGSKRIHWPFSKKLESSVEELQEKFDSMSERMQNDMGTHEEQLKRDMENAMKRYKEDSMDALNHVINALEGNVGPSDTDETTQQIEDLAVQDPNEPGSSGQN